MYKVKQWNKQQSESMKWAKFWLPRLALWRLGELALSSGVVPFRHQAFVWPTAKCWQNANSKRTVQTVPSAKAPPPCLLLLMSPSAPQITWSSAWKAVPVGTFLKWLVGHHSFATCLLTPWALDNPWRKMIKHFIISRNYAVPLRILQV